MPSTKCQHVSRLTRQSDYQVLAWPSWLGLIVLLTLVNTVSINSTACTLACQRVQMLAVHSPSFGPRSLYPSLRVCPSPLTVHRAWTPRLTFSIVIDPLTLNICASQDKRHVTHTHSHLTKALITLLTITHHSHMGIFQPCVCKLLVKAFWKEQVEQVGFVEL